MIPVVDHRKGLFPLWFWICTAWPTNNDVNVPQGRWSSLVATCRFANATSLASATSCHSLRRGICWPGKWSRSGLPSSVTAGEMPVGILYWGVPVVQQCSCSMVVIKMARYRVDISSKNSLCRLDCCLCPSIALCVAY